MKSKKASKTLSPKDIPVVIFCGGRGTRIKEETELVPKPLVRIGGKPILWHIMKIYYAQGFRQFVLLLGYKGDKIREYVQNYSLYTKDFTVTHKKNAAHVSYHGAPAETWQITCLDTGLDTQTGGRLKKLQKFLTSPMFMLTYGDGVADVDLKLLLEKHSRLGKTLTMTGVRPPARFGEVLLDGDSVVGFNEKPEQVNMLINGGFFAVNSSIFKKIPDGETVNFESDVMPTLAKAGELAVMPHDGYWQCMDTMRDMELLNSEWERGNAPWKVWR